MATIERTFFNSFDEAVVSSAGEMLRAADLTTIQVNIGLTCNLACRHCHVSSGPRRTEQMDRGTMEAILHVARETNAREVDITGGAPEMNPHFREFVTRLREQGTTVKVRTNLTIVHEPGFEDLPLFFRMHQIQLVASMPCYLESNVDKQRGQGVYDGSIEALRLLNAEGYGIRPELPLHLVYNPGGPSLPPPQAALESDYRRELRERFGIEFTGLFVITNMPIGRFMGDLHAQGRAGEYMTRLRDAFNPTTLDGLMCRHQINVRWDGQLFDCDFNLALNLPVQRELPQNIRDFDPEAFIARRITTAAHCFGCTAGCGSSCGGALVG